MSLEAITQQILEFRDERDWKQFHSPRNLAASISIEAAELLELFQWASDDAVPAVIESKQQELAEELADVLIYALLLAADTGVDVETAVTAKLGRNREKYPVDKARGVSTKYTEL
ncbi:MAG: nucleotide pyrophosphohydrolase [Coriobacteriia bacterium]|nr:nucleotide pyrophosphohydrolase [Coriobacteriia bacterium]